METMVSISSGIMRQLSGWCARTQVPRCPEHAFSPLSAPLPMRVGLSVEEVNVTSGQAVYRSAECPKAFGWGVAT